jgi:hypothetical protein
LFCFGFRAVDFEIGTGGNLENVKFFTGAEIAATEGAATDDANFYGFE